MDPGSMPPALRDHTNAYLTQINKNKTDLSHLSSQQTISCNVIEASSSHGENGTEQDDSIIVFSDDESTLPPAPPPSLIFRLYQNSDSESRSLLCDFIEKEPEISINTTKRSRRYL